jgi:hypothetical protein
MSIRCRTGIDVVRPASALVHAARAAGTNGNAGSAAAVG